MSCDLAFCASTGRTATMFLASTLNSLPGVVGLHEGQQPGKTPVPLLPLINIHNRKAWRDPGFAEQTVRELRDTATLSKAAGDAGLVVDVAFYNAPLMVALARQHPTAKLFVIFRRCAPFVQSATLIAGEDRQPAGWPDPAKPLTDRETFISMGRLKPERGSEDAEAWPGWSGIERNIWLWTRVNGHLLDFLNKSPNCRKLLFEDLVENPRAFWTGFLRDLGLFSERNLTRCLERSAAKVNDRPSYHVGPVDSWSDAERALYAQRARPLEERIYE
ncbi:MAG: hypothetical protein QNJ67_08600 [Kiloniellales bacterium]|nr:hypothetical protein [Kiloniellales bacterium]